MERVFVNNSERNISLLYFTSVIITALFSQKSLPLLWEFFSLSRIPLLIILYFSISKKKNIVYFIALILFLLTHLLFKYRQPDLAGFSSLLYRFLTFILVFKSFKNKNWFALSLAAIPFLGIYLLLLLFISDFILDSIYFWLLNGFFTSLIGGMAIYNYIYENENKNFWLLISAILFIIQIGFFFFNHFYLPEKILVQMTIILFGVSNFTFYKFILVSERKELNKSE